jgi:hypothetical protein
LLKAFLISLFVIGNAYALPMTWNLNGVTLQDSTTLSGSFTYDPDTSTVTNFNLVTQSAGSFVAKTYDSSAGHTVSATSASDFTFYPHSSTPYTYVLRIRFAQPLSSAGGNILISTGGYASYECLNCAPVREITSGSVNATPPTPAAIPTLGEWAMIFMASLMAIFAIRRMRRQ